MLFVWASSTASSQVMSEDDMDSEEEDMPVIGGEGFTPEELARAEQNFTAELVRAMSSCIGQRSCTQTRL